MSDLAIAEVAAERGLVGGPFGSNLVGSDYVGSGVPVIRGTNMIGREIGGDYVFISPDKFAADLSRNSAVPGDLVFTQRGTLGQVALVPDGAYSKYVISQSQMRLRVDPAVADPKYVYYASTAPSFVKQIYDNAISTGVPHINLGILARLTIPKLPLSVQRAIAEVLGVLDDKIATNGRASDITVSLADAEFARAVYGVSGGSTIFEEVAEIGGGGTPRTSVDGHWGGDICWATPTDVTGLRSPYLARTNRTITESGLAACSSRLYPAGSILMTSRATIGAFAVARVPLAVNQGFIVVNAHGQINQWWLFHEMRARVDEFLSHANGATFLELPRGKFKKLGLRMPTAEQARAFASKVEPLHGMAAQLMTETATLVATRDELLPLLVSGRIRVRDAEKVVEEAV